MGLISTEVFPDTTKTLFHLEPSLIDFQMNVQPFATGRHNSKIESQNAFSMTNVPTFQSLCEMIQNCIGLVLVWYSVENHMNFHSFSHVCYRKF